MKRAAFRLQPVLELRRTAGARGRPGRGAGRERPPPTPTAGPPSGETALPTAGAAAVAARRRASSPPMTLLRSAADRRRRRPVARHRPAEQAELVRAAVDRGGPAHQGLERLRERHQLALQRAEAAAEERAVDDLVTGRPAAAADVDDQEERPVDGAERGAGPDRRDPGRCSAPRADRVRRPARLGVGRGRHGLARGPRVRGSARPAPPPTAVARAPSVADGAEVPRRARTCGAAPTRARAWTARA